VFREGGSGVGGGTKIGNGGCVSTVPLCCAASETEVFSLFVCVAEKLKDDDSSKAAPAAGQLPVLSLNSGRKMVNK
jgi:hypothetical protein